MSAPMDVTIVRPKHSKATLIGRWLGLIAGYFTSAWVVMLLVPIVIDWHPGYWQTVAAVVIIRSLSSANTSYLSWTKDAKS